jgi:hypothetical protein
MPRSVVRSLSSRQALPKRCDILSERPIGLVLFPPRQRQQNGDQNIGEHRWDRDVVWPRQVNRLKQRAGVSAITLEVIGDCERLTGPILRFGKRPLAFKFHPHERLVDNPIHRKIV